jgi:capsular polysaccharide transport system permease protein
MAAGPTSVLRGWRIQARNLRALILRDLMLRHGRDNIGFIWVVLEPMILTMGVMVVWSLLGHGRSGIKVVELVLTGYMPLTLWRHLTGGVLNLFRSSSPMLYHRQITLFDIVFARQALEFIATSAALVVIWSVLSTIGLVGDIQRLDLFLLGWIMMGLLAGGVGLILAALTEVSHTAERFIQPMQYLAIPLSGAFFMVDWLPTWAQHAILLNPIVHSYEVFRAGFFGEALVTHYQLGYFFSCTFVLWFVGIVAVTKVRGRVQLN